ncbi:hypothetical protein RMN57_07625 [Kitasatospora sp. CM 4170]|uniref:Uncharacterized protein n=1 Tax=Kitasatospora aburaviensis TaxID=67265 RepID=A0ABW1ER00_9ACTN|nr:hypothetical protein [Kitasatospora sp. CM 4170]WNM44591.1 hypothetical protein RMN57_07625 [Kitasatospora sp. CM 4170]
MPALKGAFVKFDAGLLGGLPNIVLFQFNPETVSRTPGLAFPPDPPDGSGPAPVNQPGEPDEAISFTLRLDATDQLAGGNPIALASGVLPALSALELLMYPQESLATSLFGGGPQPYRSPPAQLPTVLFFWGPYRLIPVTVTNLYVTEREYDRMLNPIRVEVNVSLRVLTPVRLPADAKLAIGAYKYTQSVREVMAALNLANVAGDLLGALQ